MPKPAWREQLDRHEALGWSAVEITPGAGHVIIRKMIGGNQAFKTITNERVRDGYHEAETKD